jgi:hypothetical protein
MFLPVARDVDSLCVLLRMRVVYVYIVFWPVLEVVVLVSGAEAYNGIQHSLEVKNDSHASFNCTKLSIIMGRVKLIQNLVHVNKHVPITIAAQFRASTFFYRSNNGSVCSDPSWNNVCTRCSCVSRSYVNTGLAMGRYPSKKR